MSPRVLPIPSPAVAIQPASAPGRRNRRPRPRVATGRQPSPANSGRLVAALHDGTCVEIRPLVPADRELVAATFERLSAKSRYMRFLSPMPSLPKRTLDMLVDVDQEHHVALIALQGGEPVGIVRYVRDAADPGVADLAVTVIDARQGRGLGRVLISALADVAARNGVTELHVDVHPGNRPMTALARSLGAELRFDGGLLSGRFPAADHATVGVRPCAA